MENRGIQAGDTVGDGEEELDHGMGDGNDPNEQVVDEKMWDEDEDEEEQNQQEEEKEFEKIARCLETLEDELQTKEDEEGTGEEGKDDKSPENGGDNHEEDMSKNDDVPDKNINPSILVNVIVACGSCFASANYIFVFCTAPPCIVLT